MAWLPGLTALLLLAGGCSDDGIGAADGSGSSSGSGGNATTGVASDPGATSVVSGQGSSSEGTTISVDPDSSGGMDSMSFIGPGSSSGGPVEPQPNGAFCMIDEECQSGHCTGIPDIGGVCSDCGSDADCPMGSCAFDLSVGYSVCTDGSVGDDCMGDENCADGLVCADVFDAGGFGPTRCSECDADTPCPDGQGCTLITDNGLLEAYLGCIDAGTLPLGEVCPVVDGVGDGTICMSGQCGVVSIFMFEIGVCSECDADDDCMMPQTCMPPGFDMGMLTPGVCG